jgi:hypothetical protein
MDLDLHQDDIVLFELPTYEDVEAFCERLRPRFEGWSDADEQLWLFTAKLADSSDLAPLLREAAQLVAELGLEEIDYCVDGRAYVLAAAPAPSLDLAMRSK